MQNIMFVCLCSHCYVLLFLQTNAMPTDFIIVHTRKKILWFQLFSNFSGFEPMFYGLKWFRWVNIWWVNQNRARLLEVKGWMWILTKDGTILPFPYITILLKKLRCNCSALAIDIETSWKRILCGTEFNRYLVWVTPDHRSTIRNSKDNQFY